MGLHSTGNMTGPGSHKRSSERRAGRRMCLEGFPKTTPFSSIEEVVSYLSGDHVLCLLCGKPYRSVAHHILSIHGIDGDQYKEMFKIPWTYALCGQNTSEKHRKLLNDRIADGYIPPMKVGADQRRMINHPKRETFFKKEIAIKNINIANTERMHPLEVGPNGEPETFTTRRERLTTRQGTVEFKEKMKKRPQCQPEVMGKMAKDYWTGRKQTPDHVAARTKARMAQQ